MEDFGSRFFYEKKFTNNMGEFVLIEAESPLGNITESSPMESAVKIMVENIEGLASLDGFLLSDIEKTMNIIWSGGKWDK